MLYPEGVPGIGKGFNRKYQLQRLATSMVRLGLQHGTDIMPVLHHQRRVPQPLRLQLGPG